MVESTPQWRVHGLNAPEPARNNSSSKGGAARRAHSAAAGSAERATERIAELATPSLSQHQANLALQAMLQRHEAKVSGLLRAQHKLQTENAQLMQEDADYRQRRPAFAKMEVELARQDALLLALSLEVGEAQARKHLLKVLESGPKLARRQKTREELRWQVVDEKKKLRAVEEELQKLKSTRTGLVAIEAAAGKDLIATTTAKVAEARARVVELEQENVALQVENSSLERLLQHGLAVIERFELRPQPADALDFGGESRLRLQAVDAEIFDLHEEHTQLEEAIIGADDRVKEAQGDFEEVRSRLAKLCNQQTEVVQDSAVVFQAQVMAERKRLVVKRDEVQKALGKLKEARANKGEASRGGKLRLMRLQRDFAARGEAAERLAEDALKEQQELLASLAAEELHDAHRLLSDAQLKTKFAEEEQALCAAAMPHANQEAREAEDQLRELQAKERAEAFAHEQKRAEFQERTDLRGRLKQELQEAKWQEEFTKEDWSKKVVQLDIHEREAQDEIAKLRKSLELAPNPSNDHEQMRKWQALAAHAQQQVTEVKAAHTRESARLLEALEQERQAAGRTHEKHRMAVVQDEVALQHQRLQQEQQSQIAGPAAPQQPTATLTQAVHQPIVAVTQDPVVQQSGTGHKSSHDQPATIALPTTTLAASVAHDVASGPRAEADAAKEEDGSAARSPLAPASDPSARARTVPKAEVAPATAVKPQEADVPGESGGEHSGQGEVADQPQQVAPEPSVQPTDVETFTEHSVDIESTGTSVLLEHVGVHFGVEHADAHRIALHSPSRGSASHAEDSEVSALSFEACLQDLLLDCIDDDATLAELAHEVEEAEATLAEMRKQRGHSNDLQSLQARCMELEAERGQLRDQVATVQLHVRKAMATMAGQGSDCPRCGHAVPTRAN